MLRVTMNAPAGASGLTIEGENYDVVDGQISVKIDHVDTARSHGCTVASGELPVITGGRPAMVQSIFFSARSVAESLTDDELIAFTSLPEEDLSKFWSSVAEGMKQGPKVIAQRKADDAADVAAEKAEKERLEAAKANDNALAAAKKAVDDKAAADAKAAAAKSATEKK